MAYTRQQLLDGFCLAMGYKGVGTKQEFFDNWLLEERKKALEYAKQAAVRLLLQESEKDELEAIKDITL